MKLLKLSTLLLFLITAFNTNAQEESSQTEFQLITATLMNYIDGTGNGNPDQVRKAFHPDFNLYSVTEQDSLRTWKGQDYIGGIKVGNKSSRVGRIIAIDYENNAASAKVEIAIPGWRIFTDYFLLLKYEGSWKIVHKSYTWRVCPEKEVEEKK